MKKTIWGVIFCLFVSVSAFAESFIWQVQTETSVTYIGGTCHLLRESDYPLPKEFDKAYKNSEPLKKNLSLLGLVISWGKRESSKV